MSKTSQLATGGKSISQVRGKSKSFCMQYSRPKNIKADASSDHAESVTCVSMGEEEKRTENFQIHKPEPILKHAFNLLEYLSHL